MPMMFNYGKKSVASYDWIDVTTGTGFRKYYALNAQRSGATDHVLTIRTYDSVPISYNVTVTNASPAQLLIDYDFDILFNVPAVIKGEAYMNVLHRLVGSSASAGGTFYLIINFYHVSTAPAETSIGTVTGANRVKPEGVSTYYWRECFKATLTQKKFAIGDKLRINIQGWGFKSGAANPQYANFYDPATKATYTDNLSGQTVGTDAFFDIPFRVDI